MAAEGPPLGIGVVQSTKRVSRRVEGPLQDYRSPARQPLAFSHASTCQGTVADDGKRLRRAPLVQGLNFL